MDLKLKNMIKFIQIFTWWNRQTFGTFLHTLFFGKLVGKDEFGNKYYINKKNKRWVIYSSKVEASRIPNTWYLWMHHTTNEIPTSEKLKYIWQKKHSENLSGTKNSYRPSSILDTKIKKKYDTWKK